MRMSHGNSQVYNQRDKNAALLGPPFIVGILWD